MTKAQKKLFEIRKGKVALTQIRAVQKLLTDAGVPEIVEIGTRVSNSPQLRLKWFMLRRKDVNRSELTSLELEAIRSLIPYGKTGFKQAKDFYGERGIKWPIK